jgi:hypothetical protein
MFSSSSGPTVLASRVWAEYGLSGINIIYLKLNENIIITDT